MPAIENDGGVPVGGRELFQAPGLCIPLHLKLVGTSVLLFILCEYWGQEALLQTHTCGERGLNATLVAEWQLFL